MMYQEQIWHVRFWIMSVEKYSRLHLIYPPIIETVKDWADCEQLTPIEVGQIFVKILPTSIGVNCSQSAQSLTVSIMDGYIK